MNVLQKYGPEYLTFVIRDNAPFIHMQEPPRHRTVAIRLTQEQRQQLILKATGSSGKTQHFEEISMVIVEPPSDEHEGER